MRRWSLLFLPVVVLAMAVLLPTSGASFTSSSMSGVRVGVATVSDWLHLYSQSTDPDGLDGYWERSPLAIPAAEGADESLRVDLGRYDTKSQVQCARVFTIQADAHPPVASAMTVTATLVADPQTGLQPIVSLGFDKVGKSGGTPNAVPLSAGEKLQVNLKLKLRVPDGVYRLKAVITVTYPGMTASFYQYSVPLTLAVGSAGAASAAASASVTPEASPSQEAAATTVSAPSTSWEPAPGVVPSSSEEAPVSDGWEVTSASSAPLPAGSGVSGAESMAPQTGQEGLSTSF